MHVPFQHLQSLVAGDSSYLHGIQALFEETAGGLMPEIVKGEPDQVAGIRLWFFLKYLWEIC